MFDENCSTPKRYNSGKTVHFADWSLFRLWQESRAFWSQITFLEPSYPFTNFDVDHKTVVLKCLWHLAVVLLYLVWLHVSKQQTVCQLMFKKFSNNKHNKLQKRSFKMQRTSEQIHSVIQFRKCANFCS